MPPTHIFFTAFPAFGHVRPFCVLAARLVKEYHDCVVTMLLAPSLLKKAEDEVDSELQDGASEETRKRVRIFSSFQAPNPDPFVNARMSIESFPGAYRTLLTGRPVTCATKGTVFDAIVPPSVLIMDFFTMPQVATVRSISGKSIPVIAWVTGDAPSVIRLFGPQSYGGLGDISVRAEEEASRLGVSPKEIVDKLYRQSSGKIIKLPGVPEMYDYEFFPQPLPFDVSTTEIFKGNHSMLKECDAVLAVNAHALEKPAIDVMKSWFSEWSKDLYAIGPLLPSGHGNVLQSNRGYEDITEFLSKHGPNSVILISFGTMFWPKDTTYLEEVVEAFIEKKFPFILSHASPLAKLSDTFKEKVKASGIGYLTSWCPQQYILDHPATGWFLTHCGHNSITEALASGVPMIAWPFEADQPAGALHLVDLKMGIELLEVRSGEFSSRPLRRNGKGAQGTREAVGKEIREVIDVCRGEEGEKMRANAELMRKEFRQAWEGGPARTEMATFLGKYTHLQL